MNVINNYQVLVYHLEIVIPFDILAMEKSRSLKAASLEFFMLFIFLYIYILFSLLFLPLSLSLSLSARELESII